MSIKLVAFFLSLTIVVAAASAVFSVENKHVRVAAAPASPEMVHVVIVGKRMSNDEKAMFDSQVRSAQVD